MRKTLLFTVLVLTVCLLPTTGLAEEKAQPEETVLEPMVVTGTKTGHTLEDVPVETVLISREDIEKSNAKSVSSLLAQIPGFNFSQQSDLNGAMGYKNTVRGLNIESRYMLVLVDGQRVFTGYHAGGMSSAGFSHNVNVVPVSMIDHIEVVKGPGSALYGSDAMVGVMNIITRMPKAKKEITAGGSFGVYDAHGKDYVGNKVLEKSRTMYESHATVGGPLAENVRATLSVSHEGNDGVDPTRFDVYQNYLHGQIEMDVTDDLTVRAGGEFTDWSAKNVDLDDDKTEQAPRLWAVGDYAFNSDHKIKVQGYYQKLDADFSDPTYGEQRADVSYSDGELQYTGRFFDSHLVTLGAEILEESLDTDKVKDTITTASLYLQDEWALLDGILVLVPGVRFDDNSSYGSALNPKFSAMYTPIQGTRIRASTGWSFKAPSALQASAGNINHGSMWVVSNSALDPERAFSWQVGVEQDLFEDRVTVGVTYYNTRVKDMIVQVGTGALISGLPVFSYENKNSAKLQGIEAMADWAIMDPLHLQLTYAFTDAKDGETNERLVDTPEQTFGAMLDYTNKEYGFGGSVSLSHTTDQLNTDYGLATMSLHTEDFTTVGLKVWKDFWEDSRIALVASNVLDEPLRGSDTTYLRRSIMAQLDFKF